MPYSLVLFTLKILHMKKSANLILAFVVSVLFISCLKSDFPKHYPEKQPEDIIIEWNLLAYDAEGGDAYEHGPLSARSNAMMHIAMHDALNAIFPVNESYAYWPSRLAIYPRHAG